MKHRLNFISGVAMLIVSATLATFVVLRKPDADKTSDTDSDRGAGKSKVAHRLSSSFRLSPAKEARTTESEFAVRIDPAATNHTELAALAKQVEAHALSRLDRMTHELDLSIGQQRRIFPMLVMDSQSYHPSMKIVGTSAHLRAIAGGGSFGDIAAELDPRQQDELLESSIDDLLLWREIIANLERQLDQQIGVSENPAPPRPNIPEAPTGGGRNLFDLAPNRK